MQPVIFALDERLANPGDTLPWAGHLDETGYTLGQDFTLPEGIDFDIALTNAGEGILASGILRAHVKGTCDRCLEDAEFDVSAEVDDVEFSLVSEDHTIDLSDAFLSALVMETPFVVLCREDCKGLCPVCGANLNEVDCGHAAQREQERMAASPFAALAGLNLDQEDDGKDA